MTSHEAPSAAEAPPVYTPPPAAPAAALPPPVYTPPPGKPAEEATPPNPVPTSISFDGQPTPTFGAQNWGSLVGGIAKVFRPDCSSSAVITAVVITFLNIVLEVRTHDPRHHPPFHPGLARSARSCTRRSSSAGASRPLATAAGPSKT